MLQAAWLFVGLVALLSTGVAASTRTQAARLFPNSDGIAIFAGIIGFLSWGFWAFGCLNIEIATNDGTLVTYQLPELAYLGVALALIPGYIALTGPANIITRSTDNPTTDDI